jgi:ABC-type nitrate/sulfonate/bicarbonate transport system substrate-binding protein
LLVVVAGISTTTTAAQTTTTVKVGLGPYYDYQLFYVAKELGIAQQAGLNLDLKSFPTVPIRQVRRGDIDIGYGCHVCAFSSYEAFPTLRNFMISNQFRGFGLIGHRGKVKPYSEYLKEAGGKNYALAKRNFVQNEVVGKSVALVKVNHLAALAGLLKEGGATTDDVKLVDFAEGALAANAFLRGETDFYTGDLPQEARLTYSKDLRDRFILAAPQQAFGPGEQGVLLYSVFFTRQDWLQKNPETAKKLLAVWFRTTRYLHERPNVVLPIVADAVKTSTGGVLDSDITQAVMTRLNYFPTFKDAGPYYYSPAKSTYYVKSIKFHYDLAVKEGQIKPGTNLMSFEREKQVYDALKRDKALMAFINAPLK